MPPALLKLGQSPTAILDRSHIGQPARLASLSLTLPTRELTGQRAISSFGEGSADHVARLTRARPL